MSKKQQNVFNIIAAKEAEFKDEYDKMKDRLSHRSEDHHKYMRAVYVTAALKGWFGTILTDRRKAAEIVARRSSAFTADEWVELCRIFGFNQFDTKAK